MPRRCSPRIEYPVGLTPQGEEAYLPYLACVCGAQGPRRVGYHGADADLAAHRADPDRFAHRAPTAQDALF
ncbi:hypothetical protein EMG21_27910 [Klebsiella pneumoniae]|nr:hypothetical protein EMG21_27910 [Klebsiella pneumoniae]